MATDPNLLVEAIVTYLAADTSITDLLVLRTVGGVSHKKYSIFQGDLGSAMKFPCIGLRFFGPRPLFANQHENAMKCIAVDMEVSIYAELSGGWDIVAECDERMEAANIANAFADTADWAIKDVDSADNWTAIDIPKELRKDGGQVNLTQRLKSYRIEAADKN